MSASSVPVISITPAGVDVPAAADILQGVLDDTNAAFGGNMNYDLRSPQGVLSSSLTADIEDFNGLLAFYINQVDPAYAEGRMQDAIARIYFLTRNPAESTTVQCVCVGLVNTVIPVGALVQDTSGNQYACTQTGTIPVGGSITLPFAAVVAGPTPCPANTVTTIYGTVPGWDTVNNPTSGVTGSNVESRADFEYRRANSVALNAHGTPQAIFARVFAVANVLDCYVIDNPTGSTVNQGATNYPLKPHSVYVGVVGGASTDIANAIWESKDLGCDMNGSTTVTVQDTENYEYPYPTYSITYNVPTATPILFAVQIANLPTLPSNIVQLVKQAILSAFVGGDGGPRARIGSSIFASRFFAPVAAVAANVEIVSLLLGIASPTLNVVNMGIDQAPTCVAANITVTLV